MSTKMAAPLRVKETGAWKTVHIPADLSNSEEFLALVDFQELTEYELVPMEDDFTERELTLSKKSRKRKRKRAKEEMEEDPGENAPTKRKKKKVKQSTDDPESADNNEKVNALTKINSAAKEVKQSAQKVKKKDKKLLSVQKVKNGLFIKTDNVMIVNGDEEPDESETPSRGIAGNKSQSIGTSKHAKKKKKKQILQFDEDGAGSTIQLTANGNKSVICETPDNSSSNAQKLKQKRTRKQEKTQSSQQDAENLNSATEDEEAGLQETKDIDMSEWKNLYVPNKLLQALESQGFDKPTTMQRMALPSAIRDRKDILGAAETGSGKTLAFGIPVLARILNSDKQHTEDSDSADEEGDTDKDENEFTSSKKTPKGSPPRALILEPTRELAVQVKKHLISVAKYTDIRFVTVVGGMAIEKQRRILAKRPEVIIATPGRLWQLIEEGNEHLNQVDRVQCLVVDEADRMVEKGHYEELSKLLEMVNKSPRRLKNRQTFMMSATLTMEIGKPKRLMKKKKKMQEEDKLKTLTEKICVGFKPKVIDLTPKDKVAQTLTELRVNCKADEKDFYLYYFLCQHPGRTLVFANSKDCLRRLISVFTLLQCSPLPLHADMHQRQRLKNLDRFSENCRGLLVASDVAARGLDIPQVDHVIHYQVPRTMENYVHRSGRTARASRLGLSVMLVGPEDAKDYRKIVYGVRSGQELPLLPIEMDLLPSVKLRVSLARHIDVSEYRTKKKRLRNNFFTKAAEEMDMIIDDTNLLEEMGDSTEQVREKQAIKQMKSQLAGLLRAPLGPMRMSKYPTKSGHLESKKAVSLHKAQ